MVLLIIKLKAFRACKGWRPQPVPHGRKGTRPGPDDSVPRKKRSCARQMPCRLRDPVLPFPVMSLWKAMRQKYVVCSKKVSHFSKCDTSVRGVRSSPLTAGVSVSSAMCGLSTGLSVIPLVKTRRPCNGNGAKARCTRDFAGKPGGNRRRFFFKAYNIITAIGVIIWILCFEDQCRQL
jgi:hypothetical protein